MGRDIITKSKIASLKAIAETAQAPEPDNYASQIIKLIPADIVGVYLGISNLIAGQKITEPSLAIIQSVVFVAILVITPFYLLRVAGITDKTQVIIATVSFVIWAVSLGGPFESLLAGYLHDNLTVKFLGGILIMIYTLIVPMFYKTLPGSR